MKNKTRKYHDSDKQTDRFFHASTLTPIILAWAMKVNGNCLTNPLWQERNGIIFHVSILEDRTMDSPMAFVVQNPSSLYQYHCKKNNNQNCGSCDH